MIERVAIRRDAYHDSVTLMLASREAAQLDGVVEASIVSATPLNLELLAQTGFILPVGEPLGPADLVFAIRAESEPAALAGEAAAEERLARAEPGAGASERPPRSLLAAARRREDANLAVISVPGSGAAHECALAIERGLHVFCFSSGFDASLEAALKRHAVGRGLLLMGPDCGTAVIEGVGIGFANELDAGSAGLIGASGTGLQQVACLLDSAGAGVSQVIGVGGRDLAAEVGGTMTLHAIELLARDRSTEVIAVIAKSPDRTVAARVAERLADTGKPGVLCFPGLGGIDSPDQVAEAGTLEHTARLLAEHLGARLEVAATPEPACRPGLIHGLFTGGTLRDEALAVVAAGLGEAADSPLALDRPANGAEAGRHLFIDYGSESMTAGRAHPMIDPSLRNAGIYRAVADPTVSVVLVDVVLGRGAHPDPALDLAPAIARALTRRPNELAVVVSLCGASADPQGLERQVTVLREAGACVTRSNAHAARLALAAATGLVPQANGAER